MVLIAPSVLAADITKLAQQVQLVEYAGADWLHFDIMDGHFVPNLSYGPETVRQLRKHSKLFFDVHLMVENPLRFLPMFENCGANQITVHYEAAVNNLPEIIKYLKERNIKIGISLKPETDVKVLLPFLDDLTTLLIMTVEPGFGGQSFMIDQLSKIIDAKKLITHRKIYLEVDGGINPQTAALCVANGADVLVAGNAIFKADNPELIIKKLKNSGEK